jgi:hypothetical protein
VPFVGGLSSTNIFHVRDLTMFFWPQHLYIRQSLLAGQWPSSWDPWAGAGQAMGPNALNQMFLPPVLLLRVLFPASSASILIVATPFPLTALGAWLFLRRRLDGSSAALVPRIRPERTDGVDRQFPEPVVVHRLAAVDALGHRARSRDGLASTLSRDLSFVALQMLSGEPVTMTGTLILAGIYVLAVAPSGFGPGDDRSSAGLLASIRERLRAVVRLGVAVAAGTVVASVQLVPMALAASDSVRGRLEMNTFWSLHPLWLLEAVLPRLFGHPL